MSETALQRIAAHEAALKRRLVTRALRVLGRTRLFAATYRRVGPPVDTFMIRRLGVVPARLYGFQALLLVTQGAKTGLPRTSPLIYVRDGLDFVVVGTNFGGAHHPAWTNNLLANPSAAIEIGRDRVEVTGALVDEAGFAKLWPGFVDIYPGYSKYIERSGRTPRMFRLRPVA